MSYQPSTSSAAQKTNVPGILLIVLGALNVIGALYFVGDGVWNLAATKGGEEEHKRNLEQSLKTAPVTAEERKQIEESSSTWGKAGGVPLIISGVLALIAAPLTILAGLRMRSLRSYGLCMTGSILAAIPCISPSACPCIFGIGLGIWALVVLLNADVKASFQ